ncbi:hypothetical protein [Mycolicibacterium flavescens]|uniref:Uncharacterized protein n=1 Tax=Mycolicibacterium flavescens TaxID=1776 RepID=A0A1E3RPP6_MYCFV|nr:hypothetical protein [Mycolicibacterium flavescens]ODQ91828.1 hypothetical protein BHQ18_02920 [Mycolicibacterium flavescens]
MEATQAISLVSDWIRSRGLDYPTEGLAADRFEAGWSVYAPVEVDESDPMAFLDMPVGRSVFLVGDSGRIEEVSSSIPPQQAQAEFAAAELSGQGRNGDTSAADFMAEFERQFHEAAGDGDPAIASFTVVDTPPADAPATDPEDEDAATAQEASQLIEPIVQQLAQLGPEGWEEFSAEFAFTVSSQIAQLQFTSQDRTGLVPVPQSVAALVSRQREVAARMPAGPWWRLVLNVTNRGETTVNYDYGDEPFPEDQLVAPEHYRDDLEAYPRARIPVWLAGYVAGPAAQGRDPRRAAEAEAADAAAGRSAVPVTELPALPELRARWAVLSAAYAGVESGWGPRVFPGYLWYESDRRSGATLFVLPGDRAVLSGGKWDSELLDAAYNGGQPLPDLFGGAPVWVNDSALNTRIRNGLLSFCFWWHNGQWHRGSTDTAAELGEALPAIATSDDTVAAMVGQTGPGTEAQCVALLAAAVRHEATPTEVEVIFTNAPRADVAAAVNQLSLAGVLAG